MLDPIIDHLFEDITAINSFPLSSEYNGRKISLPGLLRSQVTIQLDLDIRKYMRLLPIRHNNILVGHWRYFIFWWLICLLRKKATSSPMCPICQAFLKPFAYTIEDISGLIFLWIIFQFPYVDKLFSHPNIRSRFENICRMKCFVLLSLFFWIYITKEWTSVLNCYKTCKHVLAFCPTQYSPPTYVGHYNVFNSCQHIFGLLFWNF